MSNTVELNLIAKDQMSGVVRGAAGAVSGLLGQLAALAGIGGLGAMFTGAVKEGLGFQKMLEDSRISIAGVVGALHTYRDANGDVLQGEAKWQAALTDSAAVQEKLRTAALTTTATYQEMVEAFSTGVGPMSRAGIALDDTAEATQRLTQVAAAASLPMAQLAIEMRQFFAGDEMRSRLLQTLQITKEQIEEHKKAGDMMEFLREKTESYARAAQAATTSMTGQWSNLKDAIQQTLGIGMEPLFAKAKDAIGAISDQFVSFGQDLKGNLTAQFSPEIVARVEGIAETLGKALDRFKEMAPAVIDFGLALAQHVSTGIDLVSRLPLKELLGVMSDLVTVTNGWGVAIAGVIYIAGGLQPVIATLVGIPATMHAASLAMDGLALHINAATGASIGLSQALAGAATAGLFAALIAEIGLLLYTIKLAADEARELELLAQSNAKTADTMLANLDRWQSRFEGLGVGPLTEQQSYLKDQLQVMEDFIAKTKSVGGVVDEKMMEAYKKLGGMVRELLPPLVETKREVNQTGEAIVEARKKWEEFVAKVKDKAALSGLDGYEKKLAEIAIAERDAVSEAKKLASAAGVSARTALEEIATETKNRTERVWSEMTESFQTHAKSAGKTWASIGLTALQTAQAQTVAFFATGEAAVEEFMDVLTAPASKDNVAIGLLDTWHRIKDEVPGAAAAASQALRDVWDSAGRAFNDSFYNVITGRLDDLGDVFRSFADSMASTFSNLVTAMVQRWVAGTQTIGDGMRALNKSMTSEGGGLSWQGGAMAAGTGYGIGSMIGPGGTGNQVGGAVGALAGAAIGLKFGSMGGPIGMLVGSVIGAIIGGIFNKNTEKKFCVYTARLVETEANDQIGRSIQDSRDNIIGMMGDIAALTGGSVKDATDQTRKVINDWLKGRKYEVHAGSQEDIDKDFERLLGEVVPSEMLKQLFGFSVKPYEPTTELPGISGVGNFHMGNIDEGKEGPLFKMLETLGFARDKIVEIGQQIDARPAEEFIQWLNRLVGVAATSKQLFTEMGKSFADLDAEWSEKEEAGAKGAFTERATAIADAFAAIENFSGDDQLKRMEEAQQGAAEFWNDVLDYVAQLRAAMDQMSAGIQDQRQAMRDFLNPLGADETASNAWGSVSGVWGKLQNATDASQVEAAVAEAQAAIDEVFQVMAERINRGTALQEKLGGLGSISDELTREGIEAADPLRAWGREMADMQRKVEDASRQSGLAQIQTLEEVGASAEEMYRNLKGFLADIASTSASINKSIDSQIWELGVGEMDPQGQAGAITARIKELQDQLALATSPAEIAAITSEIQSLTGRYVGTFGKDDPNRDDAVAWAQEQLERTRGLAQEQLDVLGAQAEAYAKQLEETITTVTGLLEENIDDASTTIGQLSHTLGELDRVMRETMERLGDEILTTAQPIREALDAATKLFTTSIDTASGAIGGGGTGGGGGAKDPLVPQLSRAGASAGAFADALDSAIQRIDNAGSGSRTVPTTEQVASQPSYVQSAPMTGRAVAASVRRYRMATVRQVA